MLHNYNKIPDILNLDTSVSTYVNFLRSKYYKKGIIIKYSFSMLNACSAFIIYLKRFIFFSFIIPINKPIINIIIIKY